MCWKTSLDRAIRTDAECLRSSNASSKKLRHVSAFVSKHILMPVTGRRDMPQPPLIGLWPACHRRQIGSGDCSLKTSEMCHLKLLLLRR